MKIPSSEHGENMMRTCCVHKLVFVFVLTFRTTYVHNMFYRCSPHVLSLEFSCTELVNSMDNLLSYCGLANARISTSEKDLPVQKSMMQLYKNEQCNITNIRKNVLLKRKCTKIDTYASPKCFQLLLDIDPLGQTKIMMVSALFWIEFVMSSTFLNSWDFLTANIFESGPMPTPWKSLLPSGTLGQN